MSFAIDNLNTMGGLLLGQANRYEMMGRGLRSPRSRMDVADIWPFALGLFVVIVCATAYNAWKRYTDYREKCDDPKKLFRELCAIHKLDSTKRRLLKALATACEFEQPAQVFLAPSVYGEDLPPTLSKKAEQYQALKAELFA